MVLEMHWLNAQTPKHGPHFEPINSLLIAIISLFLPHIPPCRKSQVPFWSFNPLGSTNKPWGSRRVYTSLTPYVGQQFIRHCYPEGQIQRTAGGCDPLPGITFYIMCTLTFLALHLTLIHSFPLNNRTLPWLVVIFRSGLVWDGGESKSCTLRSSWEDDSKGLIEGLMQKLQEIVGPGLIYLLAVAGILSCPPYGWAATNLVDALLAKDGCPHFQQCPKCLKAFTILLKGGKHCSHPPLHT